MKDRITTLYNNPLVQQALEFIKQDHDHTIDQQVELTLIPAYSNHEENKAKRFKEMIEEIGYEVVQDEVFNTFTIFEGPKDSPVVMVSAHLDTVFPLDTKLEYKKDGERICIPGICDDTRGCAEILGILRVLKKYDLKPACTLMIGGDVGEEGVGNFRGMRHIFNEKKTKVDAFVSIDGCGDGLTYGGMSDVQFKITFKGPGGHSMGHFGLVNPIMCMGRAIAKIADLKVPEDPFTIFNVSTTTGGTGITSIASECSMTLDVRSADATIMQDFHDKCIEIAKQCADEEYDRWQDVRAWDKDKRFDPEARIEVSFEDISGSLGGIQEETSEIVQILKTAYEVSGTKPEMIPLSSTDANIPLSLGIPAATICSGGETGGTHDISEWFDPTDAYKGVQRDLICILALCGIEGIAEALISKND